MLSLKLVPTAAKRAVVPSLWAIALEAILGERFVEVRLIDRRAIAERIWIKANISCIDLLRIEEEVFQHKAEARAYFFIFLLFICAFGSKVVCIMRGASVEHLCFVFIEDFPALLSMMTIFGSIVVETAPFLRVRLTSLIYDNLCEVLSDAKLCYACSEAVLCVESSSLCDNFKAEQYSRFNAHFNQVKLGVVH